ncbi:MAG: ComEC/Rec2 family competence protein [Kiritimatiellia bacterium]
MTGTLHLFSISGLHVAMVAAILVFGLKRAGVRRDRWILWQFPALLVFVLATGAKASAIRALIMAALYWGAPLVRRRPDGAAALAASLIRPRPLAGAGVRHRLPVLLPGRRRHDRPDPALRGALPRLGRPIPGRPTPLRSARPREAPRRGACSPARSPPPSPR